MKSMIHTDAGYYTPTGLPPGASGPSYVHLWYLKDHLGNNRVLANERGIALSTHHYDPYGTEISISTSNPSNPFLPGMTDSPYKYGGKEWNATTSTYDFEARYLSPSFHRFTTMDPLCEKISPYAYCANDPVNLVDPSGMTDWRAVGKGALTMIGGIGTTAGGIALATGTGGAATPISAYLVIEGGSEVAFGLGILLAGLVSDNSEDDTERIMQIPTGMTNTVAKAVDIVTGDENHTAERITDAVQTVVTAGVSLPSDIGVVTKNLVRISNAISITSSSTIVTQDSSLNQEQKGNAHQENNNVTTSPSYEDPERDKFYLWKNEKQL